MRTLKKKPRKHRLMSLVVLYEVIKTGENSTSEISTVWFLY